MKVIVPGAADIRACAEVYCAAYAAEPWNETLTAADVEAYIKAYLNSETKRCFAAATGGRIVGVALGLIVPCIPVPYLRIEDFCIAPDAQRQGLGSAFLDQLSKWAARLGCDSMLLGTQRGFPSHRFYLKNGFEEVESVLLYKTAD